MVSNDKFTTMELFAGAGGGIIASKILGHEPIVAVEQDAYCCQVLRERVADGCFKNMYVWEGDIRLFNTSKWVGRISCINAGFPCQPFSVAGKRAGEDDERNMWPATIEVIRRIRPPFAFLENVPGLLSSGYFGKIIGDLSESGYDCIWKVLSAAEVGAPHKRDRLWILAYSNSTQCERRSISSRIYPEHNNTSSPGWWQTESRVGRVSNGMANRVDRLKAIGNGQVPLQAATAFSILWQMMEETKC